VFLKFAREIMLEWCFPRAVNSTIGCYSWEMLSESDMKRIPTLILRVSIWFLISLTLSLTGASGRTLDNLQWGQAIDGVQMSLSSTGSDGSSLQIALRNVGDHDVTLNLGLMMANGKVQLPNNIRLNVTDAQGKTRVFKFADKRHAFVAGRVDDYVVPLRAGSMYTLQLTLNQFWCYETKEFAIQLLPGRNLLTAQFEGTGAKVENLDMPGIKLMNFWRSKVDSNTLTLER